MLLRAALGTGAGRHRVSLYFQLLPHMGLTTCGFRDATTFVVRDETEFAIAKVGVVCTVACFSHHPPLLTHSTFPFAGSPEEEALQWAGEGRPVAVSIPPSKEVGATFWSFVVRWPRERAHHWWGWGSCCCHWERSVAARLGMPGLHVQQPGPANNLRDLWRCAATCRAQYPRGRGYRAEQWR